MGKHVKSVIEKAKGTDNMKTLEKGRSAYWDDATKTVVIFDPNHVDKGTVFVPKDGKVFFDDWLK